MGVTSLQVTVLHGIEGGIWAAAYRFLNALPDTRSAMLYSLSAITSYGHANLFLKDRWQLMGALEALNGMLLFGLTTAFLFAMIQQVWPLGSRKNGTTIINKIWKSYDITAARHGATAVFDGVGGELVSAIT